MKNQSHSEKHFLIQTGLTYIHRYLSHTDVWLALKLHLERNVTFSDWYSIKQTRNVSLSEYKGKKGFQFYYPWFVLIFMLITVIMILIIVMHLHKKLLNASIIRFFSSIETATTLKSTEVHDVINLYWVKQFDGNQQDWPHEHINKMYQFVCF